MCVLCAIVQPITAIAVGANCFVSKVEDIRKEHQGVLETAMTKAGQALGWKSRGLAKDTVRAVRGEGGGGKRAESQKAKTFRIARFLSQKLSG